MIPSYPQTMSKKKAIVQEGDCKCFLRVGIHRAEHIDNATKHSVPRFYAVHGWIADKAILTEAVLGMPNPEWQMLFTIRLGNYEPNQFLHLEVIRTSPTTDPGSSNGFAIVGRTKIPLPKLDHKNTAPYELVMQDGSGSLSPAGHIIVTLELKSM